MRCLVTAGKHVNNIRAIAMEPPIETIEGLLKAVFSLDPPRGYIARTPGRLRAVQVWNVNQRATAWPRSSRISNVKIRYQET
jgi:hypothetical protein